MTQLPKSLFRFYITKALRGYWWIFILWALCLFGVQSLNVLHPLTQRWLIQLFEKPAVGSVSEFIVYAMPTILLIVGIEAFGTLMMILHDWLESHWKPKISNQISEELTYYSQQQSMSFWTGRMAGKISSQISYVADGFNSFRTMVAGTGLLLTILVNVGLVLSVNRYVAVLFAIMFVFRLVYNLMLMGRINRASRVASESASTLSGKLIDSLSNFSIVKLFSNAARERKYLRPARQQKIKDAVYSSFIQRMFWSIPEVIWTIFYGLMMLMCVWLFALGKMSVAEIVFTTSVYFSVMAVIAGVIDKIPTFIESWGSAKKSYTELIVPIDVMDAENAPSLVVSRGRIEFKNVSFKYKRKWVLRNFNLVIQPGERLGLVGTSGAGKTTLVNLLMRFWDPNHGEILIDGQNIRDITQDSLHQNIAFIPQEATLFNRTLRDNIAYGKDNATDAEIRRAARRAAADKFIMATEKKYDSVVGERGIKLSGGQRQRVAIARAFLKNAPILVLDEATSALDSETEVAIQRSFEDLSANRTTIAIVHRLSTLRNMDKIVVMRDGHIVESGTHSQLLRRRGEYARLWKLQSGGFLQE